MEEKLMSLGNSLFNARKKCGLSQEEVAEKLGVSRQTISKWETDETLPDICQSKKLSVLYCVTLDDLIDFDIDVKSLEQVVRNTSEETSKKVNWSKLWSEKYPVLSTYKKEVKVERYADALKNLLEKLHIENGYNKTDSFLVLKDILANCCK